MQPESPPEPQPEAPRPVPSDRPSRVRDAAFDASSTVAGAALPLAFAPFGLFPVAFASLAALFLAWCDCRTPGRAFLRGWLFGIGAFGAGLSWVYESFAFGNVHGPLALVLTAAFVGSFALYPAVLGWIVVRMAPDGDARRLLAVFPAGWVLFEWLRGWAFTGVPWLQVGYSQIDSPASGWLPVIGTYGTGGLIAFLSGALALAVLLRTRRSLLVLGVAAAAWGAGGALGGIAWTRPAGEPIEVAIVQGNISQDQKWRKEMRQVTLDRYASLAREHFDADLVVWPESAIPGFLDTLKEFVNRVGDEAIEHDTAVLAGVPMRVERGGPYLNAVAMLGAAPGLYLKRHLVPFGEYLPLAPILEPMAKARGIRIPKFSPGPDEQDPIMLGSHALGVTICYEIAFAGEVRRSLPEAAILVTVSNDAWFGESIGPHQHLEIARVRAAETGRWLVRATNTGLSAVVSPSGTVSGRLPQFEVATGTFEVVPMQDATPYVRIGDAPIVIVLAIWFVAGLIRTRRTSQ